MLEGAEKWNLTGAMILSQEDPGWTSDLWNCREEICHFKLPHL